MNCPSCQGDMSKPLSDLGICNTCLVIEIRQRCLGSLGDYQWTDTDAVNWIVRHTEKVDEEEYGGN